MQGQRLPPRHRQLSFGRYKLLPATRPLRCCACLDATAGSLAVVSCEVAPCCRWVRAYGNVDQPRRSRASASMAGAMAIGMAVSRSHLVCMSAAQQQSLKPYKAFGALGAAQTRHAPLQKHVSVPDGLCCVQSIQSPEGIAPQCDCSALLPRLVSLLQYGDRDAHLHGIILSKAMTGLLWLCCIDPEGELQQVSLACCVSPAFVRLRSRTGLAPSSCQCGWSTQPDSFMTSSTLREALGQAGACVSLWGL